MSNSATFLQILDLVFGIVGFLSAYFLYAAAWSEPASFLLVLPGLSLSVLTFWFCSERQETDPADSWVVFIEQVSLSTGLNLIIQALLTYFGVYRHMPVPIIFIGGVLSSVLLVVAHRWMASHLPVSRHGVLMLGFDSETYVLVRALGQPVVGVLRAAPATVPAGLQVLGAPDRLAAVVADRRPSRIVISADPESGADLCARALLDCRISGVAVNDSASLSEKVRHRVKVESFPPAEFLLSPALSSSRGAMAVQAIYTNLIGLTLLVAALPVMGAIAVVVILFAGRGPVLERVECLGFQNIPFQRFRFRTHRAGSRREATAVGRFISRLRLEHIPQLINVVRGEMALVGPHAVRTEFADRLVELMPYYSHRFTVKPGIFSWARLHLPRDPIPAETDRISYDLYYVKEGSPALDLEILIRSLFRFGKAVRTPAQG